MIMTAGEQHEINHQEELLASGDGAMAVSIGLDIEDPLTTNATRKASYETLEVLLCFLFLVVSILLGLIPVPRQRPIPYQWLDSTGEYILNQVYNEPFEGETVSVLELMMYSTVLPFAIQMIWSYYYMGRPHLHKSACVYFAGVGLTMFLTNLVKLYVGYFRPLFYDVCVPDEDYQECTSGQDNDARKSFPSGHSSLSFCGLLLLSFHLERQFGVSRLGVWRLLDPASGEMVLTYKQPVRLTRLVSIACYAPTILAGFIAASRVVDNMHFPADVVGGALLGGSIAFLINGIWYPPFLSLDD